MFDKTTINQSVPIISVTALDKSPVITQEQHDIIVYVSSTVLASSICLFGIFSNIVNIIIFLKQGFKNSVNISLFGIAISDLGCVITYLWVCVCLLPPFRNADVPFIPEEINYLTAAVPHVFFCRVTSWFIAFVTIERCISIIKPLKVRQIITPTRTTITLVIIFLVNFFTWAPEYFVAYLDWKFYEERNNTLLGMFYKENTDAGKYMFTLTPLLGLISFVLVIVFTAILVFQLRRKSKWRQSVSGTHSKDQEGSLSTKDKNTMKMVIGLACLLIACNTPGVLVTPVSVFVPEFRLLGAYVRLFRAVWLFPCTFQVFNASVNIFFYYRMSSNYRHALDQLLFSACKKVS